MTITALRDAFEGLKWYFLLYAVLVLLLLFKGTKEERRLFVYPVIVLSLTLYNPLLIAPIAQKIGLYARIRRIYWLLPITLLIVYAVLKLYGIGKVWWQKAMVLILAAAFIIVTGHSFFENRVSPENPYKIADDTIAISELLHEDAQKDDHTDIMVAFGDPWLYEIRMYDASVRNVIRRKDMLNYAPDLSSAESVRSEIQKTLKEKSPRRLLDLVLQRNVLVEQDDFVWAIQKLNVEYILTERNEAALTLLEGGGYPLIGATEKYLIYRVTDAGQTENTAQNLNRDDAVTIYLIRHGQTTGNQKGVLMGRDTDYPLTDEAVSECKTLGERLSDIPFSNAYSSALGRAVDTEKYILAGAKQSDVKTEIKSGLNDIYWGEIEGEKQKVLRADGVNFDATYVFGAEDDVTYVSPTGGENMYEFISRFDNAMQEIVTNPENAGKNVLVTAHSSASFWLMNTFQTKAYDGLLHYRATILRYRDGAWYMIDFNDAM